MRIGNPPSKWQWGCQTRAVSPEIETPAPSEPPTKAPPSSSSANAGVTLHKLRFKNSPTLRPGFFQEESLRLGFPLLEHQYFDFPGRYRAGRFEERIRKSGETEQFTKTFLELHQMEKKGEVFTVPLGRLQLTDPEKNLLRGLQSRSNWTWEESKAVEELMSTGTPLAEVTPAGGPGLRSPQKAQRIATADGRTFVR